MPIDSHAHNMHNEADNEHQKGRVHHGEPVKEGWLFLIRCFQKGMAESKTLNDHPGSKTDISYQRTIRP